MKISDGMKAAFSASKRSWAGVLVLQVWAFVVAIISITRPGWTLAALLSGALVPVVSALLKRSAGANYDRGERLRQLLVVTEGLGEQPSSAELALAVADTPNLRSPDPDPLGTYYSSPKPPGPARLAHIVAESAMFTARLAKTSAVLCASAVAIGVVAGVGLLLVFVARPAGSPMDSARVAQAASMVLAFGFTTEFIGLAFSYSDLSAGARRAVEVCCRLSEQADVQLDDVKIAVANYDLALSKSPPLSGTVYRLKRRFLDESWKTLEQRNVELENKMMGGHK